METARLHLQTLAPSRRQLRLAVVTETYPPEVNGVAMSTGRVVEGLLARGHEVQLIRPRQTPADRPVNAPGFDEMLSAGIPLPRYNHLKLGLPARQALLRAWNLRRPDVVQIVTEGPLGWSAVAAARKLRLPVVTEFHTNFHSYSRYYGVGWLKQPLAAWLRRFHNKGDLCLVPTDALRAELVAGGYARLAVLARGVDTQLFSPARRSEALRAQWGVTPGTPVCAIVSRLAPEKNLALGLRAFEAFRAQRPDARLLVVGDGPARVALQASHPQHLYAGMRTGEDLAAHYASAELFLFPSLTETFGNVITEALASGLPVLGFDYAAAAEMLRDGVNGLLAPFGDEQAFVAAAARLGADSPLRAAMATRAPESVQHRDWQGVILRLEQHLEEVIGEHQRRQVEKSGLGVVIE
ncbi:MAG: glycoside hydrolase [Candidatus Dactylopiibacterium carminicum]|uniref:Glycoside hydrolase n=1 Tax=Candidatus Dactylopiibacterium carminicum TaxID=857335 RepID=A0A272EWW8_9RHOO|nr:glycosyltransferase family 1 protein [Candidatus Dactylopiibacterium carminicum]KAF7600019.1 glycosyltransferase family 1 protein [Candidatus Dactylopiibacterium carminicum]PAS94591.1 MAG: glycoside hydrolase [Candidatus Dactylopiibacterium carminicum]PAS97630.1 MAG: glycoside hydrolase [Candidatus Dactylopiibacterium carminicum]PAT00024.1 MAG: glycoside hydrolase [Candidatus Dactylopiibacterium carminicum]